NLEGDFQNLAVSGKGRLKDAGLKVNFTQVFYKIKDTDIELTPKEINLDGMVLTDTVTHHPLYINGSIEHESFKNMFYDIYISTRQPKTTGDNNNLPVQLLNTSYKDNKEFYGNVKGTGSLSLAGPQSDMFMKIDAFASSRDSSNITIPSTTSRETGLADFLVERKFGLEMSENGINDNKTNIIYDVDVTANPMLNVKVVLDELTGDEIKGKGNGTLKIRSGTSEPLSLRGRFDIDEGNYLFTFQSFFKKPFVLKKGADNFIEWNGDPYDARINLTATYTANNVSYAPLTRHWTNIDQKISNARSDVYVVAKLTDKLFSPQINFSLEFPPSSVANDDPALAFSLQQLQKNVTEMNKQATYLVVFGIFAPIENSGAISFQEIATNSLSGIFFNVINEQVRKIVSDIFKTEKLNFNFNSSVYNRNVIDPGGSKFSLGSNVNASIGSSLFKNKVIFSLGGSVEGLLQSGTIQQNVQLLPNATIEILLNESGSFRANLFYRQNIDYLTTSSSGAGRMNRAGVGISYRKEADTLWELFFKKKKPKDQK
ncbi:MAG TPA: translocation/assembly module TamB domain-containing protein, partial [Chitinophagaceae bacterium]